MWYVFYKRIMPVPDEQGDVMKLMMAVLYDEKSRLEKKLRLTEKMDVSEKADDEKQLEVVNSDIQRMEMYIDRPDMQTWSELIFIDDIRVRTKKIQARKEN